MSSVQTILDSARRVADCRAAYIEGGLTPLQYARHLEIASERLLDALDLPPLPIDANLVRAAERFADRLGLSTPPKFSPLPDEMDGERFDGMG